MMKREKIIRCVVGGPAVFLAVILGLYALFTPMRPEGDTSMTFEAILLLAFFLIVSAVALGPFLKKGEEKGEDGIDVAGRVLALLEWIEARNEEVPPVSTECPWDWATFSNEEKVFAEVLERTVVLGSVSSASPVLVCQQVHAKLKYMDPSFLMGRVAFLTHACTIAIIAITFEEDDPLREKFLLAIWASSRKWRELQLELEDIALRCC